MIEEKGLNKVLPPIVMTRNGFKEPHTPGPSIAFEPVDKSHAPADLEDPCTAGGLWMC